MSGEGGAGRPGAAVLDHLERPRNLGRFPAGLPGVRSGTAGGADGGDLVRLELRVEQGHVAAARFQAMGCSFTIAAASLATELLVGRPLAEARRAVAAEALAAALAIPGDRLYCARLVERAAEAALAASSGVGEPAARGLPPGGSG